MRFMHFRVLQSFKTKNFWDCEKSDTFYNAAGQLHFLKKDELSTEQIKELKAGSGRDVSVFSEYTDKGKRT